MKKILIIDDDVHIGNMLEETLFKEGYSVFRAYSGTEALFAISQTKPDLVLLDLMLPGLNGEEVLPLIKGIPVIVISAKVDIENKVSLLLGGAVDYVTKPFHINELFESRLMEPEYYDGYSCVDGETGEAVSIVKEKNPNYLTGTKREVYEFLNNSLPVSQLYQIVTNNSDNFGWIVIYDCILMIVTTSVGVVIFRKKDLR